MPPRQLFNNFLILATVLAHKKAEMDFFLSAGIALGLSAGYSPGPLNTLLISQALRHGAKEGLKVAMAPFITDLPIILISVAALSRLSGSRTILGAISIVGGLVLIYLAYSSFKTDKIDVDVNAAEARSLSKGTLVNFLSPHPYLFWLTIGVSECGGRLGPRRFDRGRISRRLLRLPSRKQSFSGLCSGSVEAITLRAGLPLGYADFGRSSVGSGFYVVEGRDGFAGGAVAVAERNSSWRRMR